MNKKRELCLRAIHGYQHALPFDGSPRASVSTSTCFFPGRNNPARRMGWAYCWFGLQIPGRASRQHKRLHQDAGGPQCQFYCSKSIGFLAKVSLFGQVSTAQTSCKRVVRSSNLSFKPHRLSKYPDRTGTTEKSTRSSK